MSNVIRHNNQLKELFLKQPIVVVQKNLTNLEKNYLKSLLLLTQSNPLPYASGLQLNMLKPQDVLITDEINSIVLQDCLDWNLPIIVIGRLSQEDKKQIFQLGLCSFWNLEKKPVYNFSRVLFRSLPTEIPAFCLVWTKNKRFNEQIRNIFKIYSIQFNISNNPEYSISALWNNDYNLLILDWDDCGMETLNLVNEFKKLKIKKQYFPCLIGVKDLDKPNVYQELIAGMKDLCPILFTHNEVIKLLLMSLPFKSEGTNTEKQTENNIILKYKAIFDQISFNIYHTEDTLGAFQESDIDIYLLKNQFEWLNEML